MKLSGVLLVLLNYLQLTNALNKTMTRFVESLLNRENYDRSARPGLDTDQITIVMIDMFINGLSSINEIDMEYRVDLYLRQTWHDYRLAYEDVNRSVTLNYDQVGRIWVPDLFFRNEKQGNLHDITVPNRLLRIWPNGTILYSQRVTMTLDCKMLLEKYPMDNQTCNMIIGSYGYTTSEVDFVWHLWKSPLRIKDNLMLPEFLIQGSEAKACNAAYYTGSFACLVAEVYLKRQFEYYLIQTYLPSLMVVVLSWVSFWIDIDAVPARITLGLLTVLTMTTQSSSISERLPRVSYIKAIDVWMATCLVFVFSALIEYSAVNVLYRRRKNRIRRREREMEREMERLAEMHKTALMSTDENGRHLADTLGQTGYCCACLHPKRIDDETDDGIHETAESVLRRRKNRANQEYQPAYGSFKYRMNKFKDNRALLVDVISRVLFPVVFSVFNILYWVVYVIWL